MAQAASMQAQQVGTFGDATKYKANAAPWKYKAANVYRLPIVGDVHLEREEWPFSPEDWHNLLSITPAPVTLSKIIYSVNVDEEAFDAISLRFANQNFQSYDLAATDQTKRIKLKVQPNLRIRLIKIKQRNTIKGVSKICGLWLQTETGKDIVKIDLSPGRGNWRIQHIGEDEYIIGMHSYVVADDESLNSAAAPD